MNQRRIGFKQRASQIILQVPAEHFRRIKETEGIGSIRRETQHFSRKPHFFSVIGRRGNSGTALHEHWRIAP
ncbi:unnamed protein product [Angiostrongylus costaricensis]|uniref:KH_dom_type_1 domain-containing protein n=1 Tax=Angiostrongylus costaricensis TaxID=334426 RepID=A0A0R3PEZ5_ANGCS|nr:unnamed protein product [Angiostrongylus costaricensis]